MDPNQCWNDMIIAYATKQWLEAREHAEALLELLEREDSRPSRRSEQRRSTSRAS